MTALATILLALGIGLIVLLGGIIIGLIVAEISDRRASHIAADTDHEMIGGNPL